MLKIIKNAVKHKGFSFVEFLQPCITFNKLNTFQWFQERVYNLDEKKNYDSSDWKKAFDTASDVEKKIATGIIYQDKKSIPYSMKLPQRKEEKKTLAYEVKEYSIKPLIKEFK
ncbi:MAG: hypothetical protein PHS44_06120 [Candidatus Dojkabacteria bacterium]|nr:hypothetical protein [Candidatus Dojkabacteria bacterium]